MNFPIYTTVIFCIDWWYNSGLLATDKVCLTKEFCIYDTEFGETTTAGGLNYAYDGILGLAMGNSHATVTGQISPFTQSVSSFLCNYW